MRRFSRAEFVVVIAVAVLASAVPASAEMLRVRPLVRNGQYQPGEKEMLAKMINRLRLISGQNFGYDPALANEQNEVAIAAWEQWFKTGGQIQFTPDAKMLDVPAEWITRLGWGRKSNQERHL